MLEAALEYAKRGWRVFPLHWIKDTGMCSCYSKDCDSPGKHPLAQVAPRGVTDATNDINKIGDWWRVFPQANIGLATGERSGIVALDVDPRHGGAETMEELVERHGDFTKTLWARTGSGGTHYFFRHPGFTVRNSAGLIGPGIDIRGDGGYVVAPPSNHASGKAYAWAFGDSAAEIAQMPAWLAPREHRDTESAPASVSGTIPHGTQHRTLVSIAGTLRRRGLQENEIYAALAEVNKRCEKPGPDRNIRKMANSICQYEPAEVLGRIDEIEEEGEAPKWELVKLATILEATIQRITEGKHNGIPYGFKDLDTLTGGLYRREMACIAGRPAMGKTALGACIARNVAEHVPVAVFSVEMASGPLSERFLASEARVDGMKLRVCKVEFEELSEMMLVMGKLNDLPLYISDDASLTVPKLRKALEKIDREGVKIGAVVVDYLQFMLATDKQQNRELEVASVSRGLKQVAKDFNVAMVALAQINRGVENRGDKRPGLADLRESGQIEQDCDMAAFIHRPEYYGETHISHAMKTLDATGLAELLLRKQRNGPIGTVLLKYIKEFTRFEDYHPAYNGQSAKVHDPF